MKPDPISAAQQLLFNNPVDIYHDIFHHYKVWENARKIIFFEKLHPDIKVLTIACWWHDVFKGDRDNVRLQEALRTTTLDEPTIQKIIAVIDEHSFGEKQTLAESKILFDADKVEYVSVSRWQSAADAYDNELISLEEKDKYVSAFNERVPQLVGKLHFSYSNQVYKENLELFTNWLRSVGKYENGKFI